MDRSTLKLLATRQKIAEVALELFRLRGFDEVTTGEIAEAAGVTRMTVFNHFTRKEDIFFDLDQTAREDILSALRGREQAVKPVEALRLLAHRAIAEQRPWIRFFEEASVVFFETIQSSDALKARARTIRDELAEILTEALAETVQHSLPDDAAELTASLLLATWTVALNAAHRVYARSKDQEQAQTKFLELVDQGTRGIHAAVRGTPYA